MMQFHPDLIATVHDDRMASRRRTRSQRTGDDVRWVRSGRSPRGARRRSD